MFFTNGYLKTLNPNSDQHVKSFYGKAKVEKDNDSTCEVLYSYDIPVLGYCAAKFYRLYDFSLYQFWSSLMGHHINSYMTYHDKEMDEQTFFNLPLTERTDFDKCVRKAQQIFKKNQNRLNS